MNFFKKLFSFFGSTKKRSTKYSATKKYRKHRRGTKRAYKMRGG